MSDTEDGFKNAILSVLEKFAFGISEYDLMKELEGNVEQIPKNFGINNLALFKSHFLLFNALYKLQTQLPQEDGKYLEISPLNIRIRPTSKENYETLPTDNGEEKLRAYYLDMSNLEGTTAGDVEDMLNHFWKGYFSQDKRIHALKTLGLEENAGYEAIRKRYRQLAKKLHPDRGGDKEKLQEINEAMEILESCTEGTKSGSFR